jgi:peptidoglycan/LPS O-acetylase OafA/YrhL
VTGNAPHAIRGGASLVVAVAHTWQIFLYPLNKGSVAFHVLGCMATWSVATFFLLSGILIAFSIKNRTASGRFDFGQYLQARALRIYPPLVVAVAITVGAVLMIQTLGLYGSVSYRLPGDEASAREFATFRWIDAASTLSLAYNLIPRAPFLMFNGPLWSLSLEWWLYILAGLALAAVVNRSLLMAALAAALLLVMLFVSRSAPPFWSVGLVWWMGFAVGWHWNRVAAIPTPLMALVAVIAVVAAIGISGGDVPSLLANSYSGVQHNSFYVVLSIAILCAIVTAMLRWRSVPAWLIALGGFSYTLYLIHFPLLLLQFSLFRPLVVAYGWPGHLALAAVALLSTIAIAKSLGRYAEDRHWVSSLLPTAPAWLSTSGRSTLKRQAAQ